ncbi:MAG: riboflavin kinase [Patescibacteria group bacterium]
MQTVIKGKRIKGNSLGQQLGFPTINLEYNGKENGVFAGDIVLASKHCLAAVSIGARPTINDEQPLCEIYILDWNGEVKPGEEVKLILKQKIREIKKFKDLAELKLEIAKDVETIRKLYPKNDLI